MSTSGSTDFNLTMNQIITEALELSGFIAFGQSPTASQILSAKNSLNIIIKKLQNQHVFLYTKNWISKKFYTPDEVTGTDSNIYTCIRSHTSTSDDEPVTGDNYLSYWNLAGSTGGVWASGTDYNSAGDFLLDSDTIKIEQAFIRDSSQNDLPVKLISFEEYLAISDKATTSNYPIKMAVKKEDDGNSVRAYLWPQPSDITSHLHYLKIRKIEDMDNVANEIDMPIEYVDVVINELAKQMSRKLGDNNSAVLSANLAKENLEDIKKSDREETDDIFSKPCY